MSIKFLDPRRIERVAPELWNKAGWSYALDYSWIIHQCAGHVFHQPAGMRYIVDAGCGVPPYSPLGAYIMGRSLGVGCVGIDVKFGKSFEEFHPKHPPEIIFWASSLEHNTPKAMRRLYLQSMELLAPGGMFLATIPVGGSTFWFDPSANTVLSPEDAAIMFDDIPPIGRVETWWAYRDDKQMMDKYAARYGHFNSVDPVFLIAGVKKVKQ